MGNYKLCEKIRKFLCNGKMYSFLCGSLACILFMKLNWEQSIYGDALGYSLMAKKFMEYGLGNFHFQLEPGSVEELLFSLRGYAWPWFIAFLRVLSFQTEIGWIILYSLFISFGFTFLLPEIFELLFDKNLKIMSRIVPLLLTFLIWPGLIVYTLSDIPSIIFLELGIYGMLLICKRDLTLYIKLFLSILVGFVLGFSYYIRTGNLLSVLLGIPILAIYSCKKFLFQKLIIIITFCMGVAISTIPQILINVNCNNKFSYQVPIFFTSGIGKEEYFNGVSWLRYETVVSEAYPEITSISQDELAKTLLGVENVPQGQVNATLLLKNMVTYPLEYLGIYSAKFANYIESRFGEIYIKDFKYRKHGIVIFNFFLYFVSFSGIFYFLSKKKVDKEKVIMGSLELTIFLEFIHKYFLYICMLLIPSLMHIAGTHVESRYIFGLQLFLWQFLSSLFPWRQMMIEFRNHLISYCSIFITLLGCCSAIWNFTLEKMPYFEICLQEKPRESTIPYEDFIEVYSKNSNEKYESCINTFDYSEEKLDIYGYTFKYGTNSDNLEYELCLAGEGQQYYYPLNSTYRHDVAETYGDERYVNSGIWFSQYLFDVKDGLYNIGLIVREGNDIHFIDLLYDVEVIR